MTLHSRVTCLKPSSSQQNKFCRFLTSSLSLFNSPYWSTPGDMPPFVFSTPTYPVLFSTSFFLSFPWCRQPIFFVSDTSFGKPGSPLQYLPCPSCVVLLNDMRYPISFYSGKHYSTLSSVRARKSSFFRWSRSVLPA